MRKIWPNIPLAEVLIERQEMPDPNALTSGEIPIISKIGFNDGLIQFRANGETKTGMILVRPGDIVVSGINAAKGAIAIYGQENCQPIAATIHYAAYIPRKDRVDTRYLWWLLRSNAFRQLLVKFVPGGIKTELKAKRLLPIPVPLPPLEEQQLIVARIEQIAAKIEEAHRLSQRAIEEVSALLNAAMATYFDFSDAKTSVADYAKVQGGYAFPSYSYDEFGTHQVLRIGNVRDGFLDLSRAPVRLSPSGDTRILRYELRPHDIVISMTGTRNKRDYGFVAKVPIGVKLLLNQRVGRFVINHEIDRDYLFYFLRSPFFRDHLFPSATGTANQANVGNCDIERVPFSPPESLTEQRSIVAKLEALQAKVDALKRLQTETAAELDALLPSILDRAFKGEL